MALRFLDSFDHYLATDAEMKWTAASYHSRETAVHGYGMKGSFHKGMLFPDNIVIMEAYIKRGGPLDIFSIYDDGLNSVGNSEQQIACSATNTGAIKVDRWGGDPADPLAQTAPDLLRIGTWYHFGWKVLVHPTAGSVEVRLNGETLINLSGIPTINNTGGGSGLPYWSGTVGAFHVGQTANNIVFDDLVVMDGVDDGLNDPRLPGGGGFDKFLGAVEIVVKRPNGIGSSAEWTPAPAGANWMNVDDIEPDGDTSVNSAAATANGATDLFAMEDLLVTQDVVGAQSLICCRKIEEGFAAVSRVVKDGGTTTVGDPFYLPDSYSYLITPEPTLPDGSLWTRARWNAIEYGYRRMA
jgi:hypothetical protein